MRHVEEGRPIALITGASRRRGIGAAISRALAERGHDIAFTHWQPYDRDMKSADEDGPQALAQELAAYSARVSSIEIDLSEGAAASRLFDQVETELGFPRVLVNNAAFSRHGGYQTLDAATLDAHYAVNVRATALLSVEFARRWTGGLGGRIINLTSGQSLGPMPNELAYVASKGAIEALTLSLSAGVAPLGITVNAVNPGPTDTGWMTPQLKEALLPMFPFGRIGEAADAARLVAFLASPDAAWITGQILHSEGGFLRS
ncbi:MAG: SDR family oxidoreductase [Thermomicrobiales bacterium]